MLPKLKQEIIVTSGKEPNQFVIGVDVEIMVMKRGKSSSEIKILEGKMKGQKLPIDNSYIEFFD